MVVDFFKSTNYVLQKLINCLDKGTLHLILKDCGSIMYYGTCDTR